MFDFGLKILIPQLQLQVKQLFSKQEGKREFGIDIWELKVICLEEVYIGDSAYESFISIQVNKFFRIEFWDREWYWWLELWE